VETRYFITVTHSMRKIISLLSRTAWRE
jgi:hypothetical protein